jgi:myo-inositol-1-phosphate synthase
MHLGMIKKEYGITTSAIFPHINFVDLDGFVFSGWDYFDSSQYDAYKEYGIIKVSDTDEFVGRLSNISPYKGIRTDMDIPIEERFNHYIVPANVSEAISILEKNIYDFKVSNALETVIVIYLGSPCKKSQRELKKCSYEEIFNHNVNSLPSSLFYAVAAMNTNSHFVDFTPSETLEFDFLWTLAEKCNVQLSGRDGSTGQTMLKLTIASMLKIRNLKLQAWYSTNILGNHDGYILTNPDYAETKIEDKMNGIAPLLGYDNFEHKVTIDFFKTRFDSKESWDSIDFTGWLNTPMKLKMNWQGEDAILSAPLILDIIRLVEYGSKKGIKGFQRQLGLFYKHPFGCEGKSLESMYEEMIEFYNGL